MRSQFSWIDVFLFFIFSFSFDTHIGLQVDLRVRFLIHLSIHFQIHSRSWCIMAMKWTVGRKSNRFNLDRPFEMVETTIYYLFDWAFNGTRTSPCPLGSIKSELVRLDPYLFLLPWMSMDISHGFYTHSIIGWTVGLKLHKIIAFKIVEVESYGSKRGWNYLMNLKFYTEVRNTQIFQSPLLLLLVEPEVGPTRPSPWAPCSPVDFDTLSW